ncbi:hypothetical protein TWF281_011113 [Arthrobotrys megalospora]
MCTIDEYISWTGCGHNIDVFTRCGKAIKEGNMRCSAKPITRTEIMKGKPCQTCGANELVNGATQGSKFNRLKNFLTELLNDNDNHFQTGSKSKKRKRGRKRRGNHQFQQSGTNQVDFDQVEVDYMTMELDYGEAKENIRPKG